MRSRIDLKEAINAVSDVIQNRPRPLRQFDQIHMKTGDMVLQSEIVADWADGKRLAFIGDGDAISVCVAYLKTRGVLDFGPTQIVVFDFDERVVEAVKRFAEREGVEHLDAQLYNCLDAFPRLGKFDCFYTNPPWGASNGGESVNIFAQRGMEAIHGYGEGMLVIADDNGLPWAQRVLARAQQFALERGYFVSKMQPKLHLYHLDDDPDLKSCNLYIKSVDGIAPTEIESSAIIDPERLTNFYGKAKTPRVKYVRQRKRLDYGMAHDDEYELEFLGEIND